MEQHIELFFKEGSSDKVYKANLIAEGSGFIVNFAYGRKGAALTTGQKTGEPVSLEKAQKIYNKLIQEKTAKGYVEDLNGKPFTGTVTEARDTGIRPQLLNEIEEEDVEKYLTDPDWCAQEKFDGRRRMIIVKDKVITGTNRKGLSIDISPFIESQIHKLVEKQNVILDGEAFDDYIVIFDLPIPEAPYEQRYAKLEKLFGDKHLTGLDLIKTAWNTKEKRALYKALQHKNAEGIVFKNINAEYKPGRPNSGGDQLKFKFCATATCIVGKVNNTKRSVSIYVLDEDTKIEVGNVTVYPNQEIPKVGDMVEVKYLYYFAGGSLFQPVLLGERDDMDKKDCSIAQLKYKRDDKD